VINPKLTGRLQLCGPKHKKAGPIHAVLHLSGGQDLRYVDQKKMGQVFVTRQPPEQSPIADYAGMGPGALEISREDFKARLRKFRGEIGGILTRGDFVAGIGNADEVLWAARLHPYRKRTSLTAEEVDRLYDGMRTCLLEATTTFDLKTRRLAASRVDAVVRPLLAKNPQCGGWTPLFRLPFQDALSLALATQSKPATSCCPSNRLNCPACS
jgi:formamidopyrimidine-DNA glycosylase